MRSPTLGQERRTTSNKNATRIIERGSLGADDARIYPRLGVTLVAGLLGASLLVWTGVLGRLLTWGEWGRLTVADLLGFLIVAGALLALGLFIVLFTVRAALRQVELALRVADHKVDRHVETLTARVDEAEQRTHAHMVEQQKASERRRQALLVQIQAEARDQLVATRREAGRATRHAFQTAAQGLKHDLATTHPTRTEFAALASTIDGLQTLVETMRAEAAVFEESMDERTRAAADMLAHDTSELHAGLIRARAEMLRAMKDEVQKALAHEAARDPAMARAARVRGWLGNGGR